MSKNTKRAELAKDWFRTADRDYCVAKILANGEHAFYENACFHCQQAVEKLFKGIIIYHTGDYEKIHDLAALLKTIKNLGIGVEGFSEDEISDLNPYYTRTRYVADAAITEEDARSAIKTVEKVKRFVEHEAGLEGIDFGESWWESV